MSAEISEKTAPAAEQDLESKMERKGRVDAALEYLNQEDTRIMSEIDEAKLVRKIDWMIVPMMLAAYLLQCLNFSEPSFCGPEYCSHTNFEDF